jgi:hypothetical protein
VNISIYRAIFLSHINGLRFFPFPLMSWRPSIALPSYTPAKTSRGKIQLSILAQKPVIRPGRGPPREGRGIDPARGGGRFNKIINFVQIMPPPPLLLESRPSCPLFDSGCSPYVGCCSSHNIWFIDRHNQQQPSPRASSVFDNANTPCIYKMQHTCVSV